jgi:methionyl-tRNA formyltransferase
LEAHPEIEFQAAFCQSQGQSLQAVARDLWQRRGFLALPLFVVHLASRFGEGLARPQVEARLNRTMALLADRIHFVPDIHAKDVIERVRALAPDLGLIYGSPILRPKLFGIPKLGTLGIHHGTLPDYRGKKTTFWAMYNGEESAGVAIQKVNAGLDAGEIVKLGKVAIGHRSRKAVWRELEALGIDLYVQAILEVKEGSAVYRVQPDNAGRIYRDPRARDLLCFWMKRFVRLWAAEPTTRDAL